MKKEVKISIVRGTFFGFLVVLILAGGVELAGTVPESFSGMVAGVTVTFALALALVGVGAKIDGSGT